MILELATFHIRIGQQAGFETAFDRAQLILASMPGYIDHELQRCIEMDARYRLLVHWDKLEDHTVGFRQSPRFAEWRALLQPFFGVSPEAEHYRKVNGSAVT